MIGKFAIVLLALCAFQSTECKVLHNQSSRELLTEKQVRGLLDDIKNIVNKVLDTINDKLSELESIGLNLIDQAELIAVEASQNVTKIVDAGIELIQQAAQKVIDIGLDPSQCLGNVIDGLQDLKGSTINGLTECVTQRLGLLRKILSDSMDKIRGYIYQIQGFINEAEACNGGWLCLTGVAARAALAAANIPIEIGYEIVKCNGLMAVEMTQLVKCTSTQLEQLASTVKNTVVETTGCLVGMVP